MHGPMSSAPRQSVPSAETQARLLTIIDSAMDGIITVDEAQRVVMFNQAAERIFGVPASRAMGMPLSGFIPERFREAHAHHVGAFGRTGQTSRQMGRLGTVSGLRADGTEFPIEASISQAVCDGERLYTVIIRDIAERRSLEAQLIQSQKMEGIGRLAGGIAHDFNNLLMAVFNYLKLASNRLEPGHPARPALAQAHEAATRAAELTRQLLTFARKQAVRPRLVWPRDILSRMDQMLRRLIGDDIDFRTEIAPDTGAVMADPSQLEQVLMNLVVNARDAMPEGGRLAVATANLNEPAAADGFGRSVEISVSDTGHGMSPEVLSHLFEPFFTTKEPGKGTGLGLAICHGIVRQSGGRIEVRSSPGAGSRFRVILPRAAPGPDATG
jgi:PAS domain S-box-containing protein